MATKKTATKKKTASSAKKKTTAAAAPVKKTTKKVNMPIGIYKEKNPENHVATGKYVFFYVLFAFTTVAFAILAVWLFVFSSELMNKYESLDACVRNGQISACKTNSVHNEEVDVTVNDDDEEKK